MAKEEQGIAVKTIMWALNRDNFAELGKFSKQDVLYNPERDGKSNRMCHIMEKQKFNRLMVYFEKKGDPLTKDDLFVGSDYKNTVIFKAFNSHRYHQIERVCEKSGTKITKDDVFNRAGANPDALIRSALYAVKLDKLDEMLGKSNERLTKEDFLKVQKDGLTLLHWAATDGRLYYVANHLQKKGTPLVKADLFDEKCGISPFELSLGINAHQALGALDVVGAELERNDFLNKDGSRKPLFDKMVYSWGLSRFLPTIEKEGIYLTRDEALNTKFGEEETPLYRSINGSFLKKLADNLDKGGNSLKRNDFLADGGYQNSSFLLLEAVFNEQLNTAQEIVKKNGEKPFTLLDIPADHPDIYRNKNFLKIFGIKDFSDKPAIIKQFWEKVPEGHKNKATEIIYQKALRDAVSKTIHTTSQTRGSGR